jgi:hypothetical protein
LLSFIVAQISLIALCVPDEPSASCQPSAGTCWRRAGTRADLGQRVLPALLAQLAAGEEAAGAGDAAGLQAFALQGLHARPMMNSVEPPPMSITSRRWPGLGGCAWATPR